MSHLRSPQPAPRLSLVNQLPGRLSLAELVWRNIGISYRPTREDFPNDLLWLAGWVIGERFIIFSRTGAFCNGKLKGGGLNKN